MKNSILIFVILCVLTASQRIKAQESREYKLSDKAYGLTWDGTYFYYLDSERRALIRFNEIGGQEIFNIGLANMKGITFDSREGRILVTAPRVILKIDPNTGGVVDRLPIPITHIAGIASDGGLYYLLDIENGKINLYDKASSIIVGGFLTDRAAPKDIAYGKNSLWVSDSSNSTIYRYNPSNGRITGTIQAPADDIRGIVFSNARLWVVDRASKLIKDIPFVETDKFLSSGEADYIVNYKLIYTLPDISLAKAEVGIVQPPTNEQQRIRSFESKEKGFRTGVVNRERSINKKLSIDQARGNQTTNIEFQTRISNTVYYVDDRFLKKKESIPEELDQYRDPTKDNYQLEPIDILSKLNNLFSQKRDILSSFSVLRSNGFPTRLNQSIIVNAIKTDRAETNKNSTTPLKWESKDSKFLDVYLPGFGWIPYSNQTEIKYKDNRTFTANDNEISLFQINTNSKIASPVYFRSSPNEEWKNLESRWEVTVRRKQ
ncbi:hypothetical protein [Leptospira sp. GIMC2001]|uniref:hypothetical protein n=1 Tax=Leptospira sp. GIMC2001 TaxID=1513297 RepID=UPI00234B2A02|nr:hypothetical protein [Leptospira sp. GIMC2001]WCL49443.1 hypothetical protein O4O04_19465 [Leptospira sp. GIMC2001]